MDVVENLNHWLFTSVHMTLMMISISSFKRIVNKTNKPDTVIRFSTPSSTSIKRTWESYAFIQIQGLQIIPTREINR